MSERPPLVIPSAGERQPRAKTRSSRPQRESLKPSSQHDRLSPKFKRLQEAIDSRKARLQLETQSLVPEEVVVLETIGTVQNLIRAVERVEGLEWLAEIENRETALSDEFPPHEEGGKALERHSSSRRVFLILYNQQALRELLSLWDKWRNKESLAYGHGRWKQVFEQLSDVRHWGIKDRLLETGVLEDWQERINEGEEVLPCEVELWYRKDSEQRRQAQIYVENLVTDMDGEVVTDAHIPDIAYHALLIRINTKDVLPLIESNSNNIALMQCEKVQFFRATGKMLTSQFEDTHLSDIGTISEKVAALDPVIALLDGLPLQSHGRLQDRLQIDDPDGFEKNYPAKLRHHGTAMASLIIYGDLSAKSDPTPRPIYVRPILKPDPRDWIQNSERVPEDILVVDLIHRAVKRLFEGEGTQQAVAPHIALINLSIGISDRPFIHSMSPLARLLDWLSWRYKVLFIVSAGNYSAPIEVTREQVFFAQDGLLASIIADVRNRRLISPAESLNALTVGSVHHDESGMQPLEGWDDPYIESGLPSLFNAQGMGYRRTIKPDILAPGGRTAVRKTLPQTGHEPAFELYLQSLGPGQLVAFPSDSAADISGAVFTRGTSNSTALASRAGSQLYDLLDQLSGQDSGSLINDIPRCIWLKLLIVHGATWGDASAVLRRILSDSRHSQRSGEYITRLLGYGIMDLEKVKECTNGRVTMLTGSALSRDETQIHRFPLPPSLSDIEAYWRLTVTLAYISPVFPSHQTWCDANVYFELVGRDLPFDRLEADHNAVRRGTLQHEIFGRTNPAGTLETHELELRVSCLSRGSEFTDDIPYAIAVTLEVAEDLGIDIYREVRSAVYAS